MSADLDFSNITDHFDLTYTDDDNYLSNIFIKAHNDGVICDNYNNAAWDYVVPVTYGTSTSNTDWSNHGSYYPCIAIIKVDDNCYFMIQPAWSNAPSLSLNYVYVGRFRYTDNTYLRPNFYAPLALSSFCIAGQFRDGDNNAFFLFNPGDSSVSGKWASFESNLESMQNNPQYMLKGMFHEIFQCFTGVPNGYTPPAESNAQITAQNLGKITIETNIPIFLIKSEEDFVACHEYYRTGDAQYKAYAWDGQPIIKPSDNHYYIYESGYNYEIDDYGDISITSYFNKWVRFAVTTQKLTFYPQTDNDKYSGYLLKGWTGHNLTAQISTDQGETWETVTYNGEFIPFHLYSDGESVSVNRTGYELTNIPIAPTESLADSYVLTGQGFSEMDNATDIIRGENLDPAEYEITTGDEITTTNLNLPSMSNYLFHQYIINDSSALYAIGNILFNNNQTVIDDLINATQLFGSNHMDCLIDFIYYPVDLSDYWNVTSTTTFNFGSYSTTLSNGNIYIVGTPSSLIDCGSIPINPIFKDFRDFEPYCCMFLYLPYIGTNKLSIDRYLNKTMSIKYAIDINTGACTAFIFADDILMDSFDGTIGCKRPLIARDQNLYSQSVLNNIANVVTDGLSGVTSIAGGAMTGNYGSVASGTFGILSAITGGVYGQTQIDQQEPRMQRGHFSGSIGQFAPQSPLLYFGIKASIKSTTEPNLQGYPSNASGKVNTFSGFLKCKTANVASARASADEIALIHSALSEGILI